MLVIFISCASVGLECDNGGVKEVNALIKVINFLDSRSKSSQILVSFKLNLSVFYL